MDIKILDTGYGTAEGSLGSKSPVANRAGLNLAQNATNAFTLQVKDITLNGGGNIQDETEIRTDDSLSSSSVVSHKNPTVVLPCSISVSDIPSDFDKGWLWQLIRLERTKSVKILYITTSSNNIAFSGTSTTTSNTTNLTDSNALFGTNELVGMTLKIISGDNAGEEREITSNNQTEIGVGSAFSNTVVSGVRYQVIDDSGDFVGGRLPEIIELYGQGYKGGALASEAGGATIPYIPGYVSISNIRRNAKTDDLNFQITFKTI